MHIHHVLNASTKGWQFKHQNSEKLAGKYSANPKILTFGIILMCREQSSFIKTVHHFSSLQYIVYSIYCIVHCVQYIVYSTLCIVHCVQYIVYSTLCIVHCNTSQNISITVIQTENCVSFPFVAQNISMTVMKKGKKHNQKRIQF